MQVPDNSARQQRSLLQRVLRGGAWLGIGGMAEQGLRLVRNMVLARLLAPEAFGVMAIVLSFTSLVQVLTSIGIKEAIIQNPEGDRRSFLDGTWWLSVLRTIVLYSVVYVAAPWVASFYQEEALAGYLRVAFLGVIFQGALSPGAYLALKRMHYSKWVMIQQAGGIVGISLTVALAFQIRGTWALAIGYAVEPLARCVLSYLICPYRPGCRVERNHLRAILAYAQGMFGLPVLMLVYSEGTIFMAGRLLSKHELGLLSITLGVARIPTMLGSLLVDLLMPAYSQIQNDHARINRALLRTTASIAFAGALWLCTVAIFGELFLGLAFGPAYAAAATAFTLLTANELIMTCNVPVASIFLAAGKPAMLRKFSAIRAGTLVILGYPLIKQFGLIGAAAAPLIAMLIAYGFQLASIRKLTGLDLSTYGSLCLRSLMIPIPLLAAWLATGAYGPSGVSAWTTLAISGLVALSLYAIIVVTVGRAPRFHSLFVAPIVGRNAD